MENDYNTTVSEYWLEHYICDNESIGVCSLCGNSGFIDTRAALSPRGTPVGRINYCFCPNGQALRKNPPLP